MDHHLNHHDADSYSSSDEVHDHMSPPMRQRPLTESEWIDEHWEELGSIYYALEQFLDTYGTTVLQRLTFQDFCHFCYTMSHH